MQFDPARSGSNLCDLRYQRGFRVAQFVAVAQLDALAAHGQKAAWIAEGDLGQFRDHTVGGDLRACRARGLRLGDVGGDFRPAPAERRLCATCAYATVCRKEYVDDVA